MASEIAATATTSEQNQVHWSKYSKKVVLNTIVGREDRGLGLVGDQIIVGGWVKSFKERRSPVRSKSLPAMVVGPEPKGDVSCSEVLMSRIPLLCSIARIIFGGGGSGGGGGRPVEVAVPDPAPSVVYLLVNDGSCVSSLQVVIDSSVSLVNQFMVIGTSVLLEGLLKEPSVPGKHVIELKVEKMASVTRIRSALGYSTHIFCQNNGFFNVHMPILTSTDSRGHSEMFQVTTLLGKAEMNTKDDSGELDSINAAIKEKRSRIEQLKRNESDKEALLAALRDLQKANELVLQIEQQKSKSLPSLKDEKVDFSKDYFSRQANLTNSSVLHLESYACALSSVYAFGPVFQAEKTRHLAESWMVELELAFADMERILESNSDDLKFLSKRKEKTCIDSLQLIKSSTFEKITYTDAVELLKKVTDKTFKTKIEWGMSLDEEHESHLAEAIFKQPVIVYDFPKEVKPFYMRLNDDGRTVSAFDIVVPKVGVLILGGQREEQFESINKRIEEHGLPREQYEWYLDLRRHGTVKHSGFSLQFEHMVMLATGVENIRDVIPYPRTPGKLSY
ncbi:Asparagine--tRNA ligase, cytoplasmic 2 [Acorus gramineus]|uniref:Asparagine--tRNA ligase, cytoplasmic 2 n=1 Tax=Acorus gramineus TaxID=55184 RepID=A0AAV9A303_ACOGR|nr:Asparagine--tRNA ligase, cytoplasmic 2 [Acorus gramineus]KAK1258527.1 Asparagine--tRNA ligase, cytoplasmic 2 [Acorus gramineus]